MGVSSNGGYDVRPALGHNFRMPVIGKGRAESKVEQQRHDQIESENNHHDDGHDNPELARKVKGHEIAADGHLDEEHGVYLETDGDEFVVEVGLNAGRRKERVAFEAAHAMVCCQNDKRDVADKVQGLRNQL